VGDDRVDEDEEDPEREVDPELPRSAIAPQTIASETPAKTTSNR
jgi:hypothetical protein